MSSPHNENARHYWKANLRLMIILLSIWFFCSFCLGIIFAEPLNAFRLGGYKLGFWFAQQGSIYIFVALIFVYARMMAKLDREHGVEEEE